MIAGSASAIIVLDDAQWGTYFTAGSNAGTTFGGSTDIAGDPGYEFTVTANPTEDWGFGALIGFQEVAVGMGGTAVDVWEVEIQNTGTNIAAVQLIGWTSVTPGGGDWTYAQSGVWTAIPINPGDSQVLSWDIGTAIPTAVAIDALGLMILGTELGPTVSVSAIPEPATLGMVTLLGGGILWIRKKFMI
jgi:hypothetical protein